MIITDNTTHYSTPNTGQPNTGSHDIRSGLRGISGARRPRHSGRGTPARRPRTLVRAAALGAAGTLLMACGAGGGSGGDDSDWPQDPVQFVIPTAAGGALDTVFREVQPYLEEELGQPLEVEYREGGQFTVGTTYVAQNGADCEPFMIHAVPDVIFSYLTRSVQYSYEDFTPVAGFTIEPSALWVGQDAQWEQMEDLIQEAQDRPGEIRVSVSNLTNANYIALLRLQEATGVEFNIVSYDGGGPARNALVAGEVEATMAGVFSGQSIAGEARPLAVFQEENRWAGLTGEAPTVNDALGVDLEASAERYGFLAAAECAEQHPERLQTLVEAVERAVENQDYQADLEDNDELDKLAYEDPEEFDAYILGEIDTVTEMIDQSPELFGDQ